MQTLSPEALNRITILMNHLRDSPSKGSNLLQRNPTSETDEISFRNYEVGKDDAAFRALDFLCCQGVKTKLMTEFLLKYAFEQIQPKGRCFVVEDNNGDMVGIARSYVYHCMINGKPTPISYAFLFRIHPYYRRKNFAFKLVQQLFAKDVQDFQVEYMTSWVVVDNLPSEGFQSKIGTEIQKQLGSMPQPEYISTFRQMGLRLNVFNSSLNDFPLLVSSGKVFVSKVSQEKQLELARSFQENYQLFPMDIDQLFVSPLNLGTFICSEEIQNQNGISERKILAMLNVWNSGEVRITVIRDTDFRSDGAVLLYNHWCEESEKGVEALNYLLEKVCQKLSSQGFKYVFMFFPAKLQLFQRYEKHASIDIFWKARVFYIINQTRLDTQNFPNVFYDPRECLV